MSVKTTKQVLIPPYQTHIAEDIIYLDSKKLMATFRIQGIPAESLSDNVIVNSFKAQKDFLVGICKQGDVYLWTHLVKREMVLDEYYDFHGNNFLQALNDSYLRLFSEGQFYFTEYYLTIGIAYDDLDEAEETMGEIISQVSNTFRHYKVSVLGVREGCISEIGSDYLNYLLNHHSEALPALSSTPLSESIRNSQFYFGYDITEIKNKQSEDNKFCVNYLVKDFPRATRIGQWNFLLSQPYEFIVTQSFIAESATKTIKQIDQQINKLSSVDDAGVTQQEELETGQETVVNGDTLFGSYHAVMSVFGATPKEAADNGTKIASEFVTTGRGFRFIKCTTEAPFVFFSHLPLSVNRPLATNRTLTNLCCLMPFHNHSYGKKNGNPVGDGTAIMPLKTVTDSLYYFNTHYSAPDKNVTGQKIAGHALILGATGAGKTTFECMVAAYLQRFDPYMFVIDYNRSTELAIRSFGGSYFALEEGVHTGLNPFRIADSDDAELMSFLKAWVKRCAVNNDGTPCSDYDAEEIDSAVDMVMKLDRAERRFGQLKNRIQNADLRMRLNKWWDKGALAWATDSEQNTFNPDDYKKVGFDTTVILESTGGKDHPACEAILSVLFFYKNRMQKEGQLMLSIVEEFWKPANFPMTQELIKSALKAGRMKGEMMWLTSQSPEDAINCAIFAAIVQQTPTKICLPNPDAEYDGYKKIGLTEKEFKQLKRLGLESRTMLIKQSGSSAFAKMDLYGFDDFLPVISGSKEGIALCEKIRAFLNTDEPNEWIPVLIRALKLRKHAIASAGSDDADIWFPLLMEQAGVLK